MNGQMMQQPLLISSLLVHAERHHGEQEIVSRRVEGDIHRTTYKELAARSRRMAKALAAQGVKTSDRVATLAWNGYRHMELYYAVSGSGAVLHTVNPRLHPDQIVYIADHAEDQVLFFDLTFLPLIQAVANRTKTVKAFVAMTDRAHMPAAEVAARIPNLLCYEELLEAQDDRYAWPEFDENTASSLCYTSGTTGNPKGVLYSHRSTVLHAYAAAMPDATPRNARRSISPQHMSRSPPVDFSRRRSPPPTSVPKKSGMTPSSGIPALFLISSASLIVTSRVSSRKPSPRPPISPIKRAKNMFFFLLGLLGDNGTSTRSTTPAGVISTIRFAMVSMNW